MFYCHLEGKGADIHPRVVDCNKVPVGICKGNYMGIFHHLLKL